MIKYNVRGRQTDFHLKARKKNFYRPPNNPTQTLCFPNGPSVRRHYVGLLKLQLLLDPSTLHDTMFSFWCTDL